MAALNIFKKDKEEKKEAKKPVKPATSEKKVAEPKEEIVQATEEKKQPVVQGGDSTLVRPHITEKATDLASKNQYVFVVQPTAAKKDIERSVEKTYGVQVLGVRIINVPARRVRLGRTKGIKSGYKKAIVQIKEGQSIEILPT